MRKRFSTKRFWSLACLVLTAGAIYAGNSLPNPVTSRNAAGTATTFSNAGPIDLNNPFFADLGSNGRTCATCHVSSTGWGIAPAEVQARFESTGGNDPIFRLNDGANCPSSDVSTVRARRRAYSLLLDRGLIRVSFPVPAGADFQIVHIDDPQNCLETTPATPAMYRRPLPSTNLPFLTTVMWDGRESHPGNTLAQNLRQQAIDATMGHAQGAQPNEEQLAAIVHAEMALFTAQQTSTTSGALDKSGASGGAKNLSRQEFYVGINDVLTGDSRTGAPFTPVVFTLYDSWKGSSDPAKAQIARGQEIFNTFPIMITDVKGLNDALGTPAIPGTCTTCHDSPNVGNHSVPLPINIGVSDFPARPGIDATGLPVYTVQCVADGSTVQTTDPGRAMVTGLCADLGKVKGPILRGLSSRAPYFHNGGARTLRDVVDFYDARFNIGLSEQDKTDLVAFLGTL